MHNSNQFNFQNLEPLNYLKTFNKMVDYEDQNPLKKPKAGQLGVKSLSKFPLPKFYYNMEGIIETAVKKKNKEQEQKKAH